VRAAGPKDKVTLVYRSGGTYAQVKTSSGRVVTSPVAVDGRAATITVAPRLEEVYKTDEKTGEPVLKNGRLVKTLTPQIGVTFLALRRPTGPVESVLNGVKGTGGTIVAFAKTIGYTVAGKIRPGLSDVEGPVRIVRRVYRAARSGLESFLWWSGFISLNIGLINLLPFPGLDGSRLAFLSVEAVRRRPVDPRKEALVHLVGIAILLLFLVVVTFREVSTLWTGTSR
jgi:regulator of sigma E protease